MIKAIKIFLFKLIFENWKIKILAGIITGVIYLMTRTK